MGPLIRQLGQILLLAVVGQQYPGIIGLIVLIIAAALLHGHIIVYILGANGINANEPTLHGRILPPVQLKGYTPDAIDVLQGSRCQLLLGGVKPVMIFQPLFQSYLRSEKIETALFTLQFF